MEKYICEKAKECTDEGCTDREQHEHNKWCECGCDLQMGQFPGVKYIMLKPSGIELIAEERKRQIEKEGWTPEHDDAHSSFTMSTAGACYLLNLEFKQHKYPSIKEDIDNLIFLLWPWDEKWWKPTPDDPIRQLVKAGALIAAEIDRLQREKTKDESKI
ncbi:MAG: hypothetical protein WC389_20720 [Lutibacter sp.]|jgi:hypothetical protein